ncbi:hypothetical protein C356_03204 [Cryptococcus neoformans c45]|nr:hypothetical protein C356_03204 [Cryptococcus neoformans var. grubii c45]
MSMDQGENAGETDQHFATAIESIFGTFINSKTEDVLQKILLNFSELDLNAIGNSRYSDVEDALVRADGKSKAGTLDFQTLLQLRDCLRLQLHLECSLSYNPRMDKPFLTPEVTFWYRVTVGDRQFSAAGWDKPLLPTSLSRAEAHNLVFGHGNALFQTRDRENRYSLDLGSQGTCGIIMSIFSHSLPNPSSNENHGEKTYAVVRLFEPWTGEHPYQDFSEQ